MSTHPYRENAAQCLLLSDDVSTIHPLLRNGLISMAHAWLQLAEEAEGRDELAAEVRLSVGHWNALDDVDEDDRSFFERVYHQQDLLS
jgi:hypothetical protein